MLARGTAGRQWKVETAQPRRAMKIFGGDRIAHKRARRAGAHRQVTADARNIPDDACIPEGQFAANIARDRRDPEQIQPVSCRKGNQKRDGIVQPRVTVDYNLSFPHRPYLRLFSSSGQGLAITFR